MVTRGCWLAEWHDETLAYLTRRRDNMAAELTLAIIAAVLSVIAFLASIGQFLISRRDLFASAKEQRLQALEVRYAEVAQPAMAQASAMC
jgi:hypothetical protein